MQFWVNSLHANVIHWNLNCIQRKEGEKHGSLGKAEPDAVAITGNRRMRENTETTMPYATEHSRCFCNFVYFGGNCFCYFMIAHAAMGQPNLPYFVMILFFSYVIEIFFHNNHKFIIFRFWLFSIAETNSFEVFFLILK